MKLLDGSLEVISLATGTRSLSSHEFLSNTSPIHDSHAEILAKRAFQLYLHKQLIKIRQENSPDTSILTSTQSSLLRLKPELKLHLFTTRIPCGECNLVSTKAKDVADTGAKPLKVFFQEKIEKNVVESGILRTKPYRSDTPVKSRSASLSCWIR